VAGPTVKRSNAGMDSSVPLLTKTGASEEGKGGRDEKSSRGTPLVSKSPRKGARHVGHHCWRTLGRSPSRAKQAKWEAQAKGKGTASEPVASMEAAEVCTSREAPGDASGPLKVAPNDTTPLTAAVDKCVAPWRSTQKKLCVSVLRNARRFLDWIRAKPARKFVEQIKGKFSDTGVEGCRWLPVQYGPL
jgi:hypothetical protein